MSDTKFKSLHFSLLEDLLPVGMAIVNRLKRGGGGKAFEGLTSSSNPIEQLRSEGFLSAKSIREKLDQMSPGLGNPAVDVPAAKTPKDEKVQEKRDDDSLADILRRVDNRLNLVQAVLDDSRS